MGEYARYHGERIKIGTCENMYYLRADQRFLVTPEPDSLDPKTHLDTIRFRFPWPDEDHKEPGDFDNPDRTLGLYNVEVPPEGVEHSNVQFKSTHPEGHLVMLPCPVLVQQLDAKHPDEGKPPALKFMRNGYPGDMQIVQQAFRNGVLVTIAQCGGCGNKYRLENLEMAEPVLVVLRAQADFELRRYPHPDESRAQWYHAIADRITAGYSTSPDTVIFPTVT